MVLLLEAVNESLSSATWLSDADSATVELARAYASHVDDARVEDDPYLLQKAIGVAGPNLLKALNALGLSPEARDELAKGDDAPKVNPIDELRKKRLKKSS